MALREAGVREAELTANSSPIWREVVAQRQAEREDKPENDRDADDQTFHGETLLLRNREVDTVQTHGLA